MSQSTGHLLRLARQRWQAEWVRGASGGLTTPQFTVLASLAGHDELDQQSIGTLAGLDKSTLGQMVDRLTMLGLVTGRVDPSNRRRKLVSITALGASALDEASRNQKIVHARMVSTLSDPEQVELRRLLRLIIGAEG